jgi:hypothetical protein
MRQQNGRLSAERVEMEAQLKQSRELEAAQAAKLKELPSILEDEMAKLLSQLKSQEAINAKLKKGGSLRRNSCQKSDESRWRPRSSAFTVVKKRTNECARSSESFCKSRSSRGLQLASCLLTTALSLAESEATKYGRPTARTR